MPTNGGLKSKKLPKSLLNKDLRLTNSRAAPGRLKSEDLSLPRRSNAGRQRRFSQVRSDFRGRFVPKRLERQAAEPVVQQRLDSFPFGKAFVCLPGWRACFAVGVPEADASAI
jgi:hypothetical protein